MSHTNACGGLGLSCQRPQWSGNRDKAEPMKALPCPPALGSCSGWESGLRICPEIRSAVFWPFPSGTNLQSLEASSVILQGHRSDITTLTTHWGLSECPQAEQEQTTTGAASYQLALPALSDSLSLPYYKDDRGHCSLCLRPQGPSHLRQLLRGCCYPVWSQGTPSYRAAPTGLEK